MVAGTPKPPSEPGHRRLLLGILVCMLAGLAIFAVLPSSILTPLPFLTSEVLGAGFVYRDAKAINRSRGSNIIDPTVWSLISFFMSFVGLALYLFVERRAALKPLTMRQRESSSSSLI